MTEGLKDEIGNESKLVTIQIVVSGRVQGVFFRSNLKKVADELSVTGWTRNLSNGSVEALLQGKVDDVRKVIDWSRVGPRNALVDSVKETVVNEKRVYRNFAVLH